MYYKFELIKNTLSWRILSTGDQVWQDAVDLHQTTVQDQTTSLINSKLRHSSSGDEAKKKKERGPEKKRGYWEYYKLEREKK